MKLVRLGTIFALFMSMAVFLYARQEAPDSRRINQEPANKHQEVPPPQRAPEMTPPRGQQEEKPTKQQPEPRPPKTEKQERQRPV